MSAKTRFKGLLKLTLGILLIAPCPVGLAVGIPVTVIGENDKNAVIEQFENSQEYAQAEQYRQERLAYIKEHKLDSSESKIVLDKEQEYLTAEIKDEDGFMYSILKESEYGPAYAKAQTRFDNGLSTALICGLDGAFLTAASAALVYEWTYDEYHYFGAISRNLIAAGAVEAFGKKETYFDYDPDEEDEADE